MRLQPATDRSATWIGTELIDIVEEGCASPSAKQELERRAASGGHCLNYSIPLSASARTLRAVDRALGIHQTKTGGAIGAGRGRPVCALTPA